MCFGSKKSSPPPPAPAPVAPPAPTNAPDHSNDIRSKAASSTTTAGGPASFGSELGKASMDEIKPTTSGTSPGPIM